MTDSLIPYSFTPGTKAKAQEVNANFIALAASVTENTTTLNSSKLNKDLSNISQAGINVIKNNSAPPRNIGEIVASAIPLTDAGLHLLDGALISGSGTYSEFVDYIADLATEYPELFETEANWQSTVTTYGVCGKFVYDDVNNTVRLPKYNSKIYTGGGTASVVGNGTSLGIIDWNGAAPDCAGIVQNNSGTKCLSAAADAYGVAVGTSATYGNSGTAASVALGITKDATKSGIIADLSNITSSLDGYYYIVIATETARTEIEVDIDEIATDLNGKADVDLSNINNTGTSKVASWAMPSDTYTTLTLGASGTTYTAPANGYFTAIGLSNAAGQFINFYLIKGTTQLMNDCRRSTASGQYIACYIPTLKGDTLQVDYNVPTPAFKFIYAQGSESEAN